MHNKWMNEWKLVLLSLWFLFTAFCIKTIITFPYTDEHFREFTSPNFFPDLIMLKKSECPYPQFFLRWKIIGIITEHLMCCFSIWLVLAVNLPLKILDVLVLYQLGKIIHRNVLMVCMQNSFQEQLSQVYMLQTNIKIVSISAIQ